MSWKKIAESEDLIVFEKHLKKHKLKIEARKNNRGWEVFKTKIHGDSADLISEHLLENKRQALKFIDKLKKETKLRIKKKPFVSMKRVYKEEYVEKWFFSVRNEPVKNFVLIKFDTSIKVDVVMNEKYIMDETDVINMISEKLGLKELGESVNYEIFYFKQTSIQKEKKQELTNFIDVEFDFSDEEYY